MSSPESSFPGALRGIGEPLLALFGAFALTLLLTAPFVPHRQHLETSLRPSPGARATPHEELEKLVSALDLCDEARVLLVRGASRLDLAGVHDPEIAEQRVANLLEREGYQRDEFIRRRVPHMEAMLTPRFLPLVMTIQAVVFSLAGLFLARSRLGRSMQEQPTSQLRSALLGVAAGVAAILLSVGVGGLLELLGLPVEEQAWLEDLLRDPAAVARLAPWIVLIVPVSEELFFRLYVFRFISRHVGFPTGLILSSLLFALIHFNFSGLLVYLGIGCILAWAYRRTGRIVAPIVGHVTLNAIVLIISQIAPGVEV
jgi:membrane protease YdiL (CAAX protease family)